MLKLIIVLVCDLYKQRILVYVEKYQRITYVHVRITHAPCENDKNKKNNNKCQQNKSAPQAIAFWRTKNEL